MVTLANFTGSKPGLDRGLVSSSKREIQMNEFEKRLRFYNTCIGNFSTWALKQYQLNGASMALSVGAPLLDRSFVTTHNINGLS